MNFRDVLGVQLESLFNDRHLKAISQMIQTYYSRYAIIIKFKIIPSRVILLIIIYEIFYRVSSFETSASQDFCQFLVHRTSQIYWATFYVAATL